MFVIVTFSKKNSLRFCGSKQLQATPERLQAAPERVSGFVTLFFLLCLSKNRFGLVTIRMRTQTVRCYAENLGSLSEKGIDSIAAIR